MVAVLDGGLVPASVLSGVAVLHCGLWKPQSELWASQLQQDPGDFPLTVQSGSSKRQIMSFERVVTVVR